MADRGFLAWPFFEAKHRAFADKVEGWCHLNSVDTADLDSECRRLARDERAPRRRTAIESS